MKKDLAVSENILSALTRTN